MFFYLRSLSIGSECNHFFNESHPIFFSGKEKEMMGIISTGVDMINSLMTSGFLMKLKIIIIHEYFGKLRGSPS